jgi:hypothetical protein
MKTLFISIGIILIIIWIIAVVEFNPFGGIHALLILAAFCIILGFLLNKKLIKFKGRK